MYSVALTLLMISALAFGWQVCTAKRGVDEWATSSRLPTDRHGHDSDAHHLLCNRVAPRIAQRMSRLDKHLSSAAVSLYYVCGGADIRWVRGATSAD